MRLIDADEMAVNESEAYISAQAKIDSAITFAINSCVHTKIQKLIADTPTVDANIPVRCKDCRWRGSEECAMFYRCECGEQHTWETDDDFCSYGERRADK